jgi:hypothetical protein
MELDVAEVGASHVAGNAILGRIHVVVVARISMDAYLFIYTDLEILWLVKNISINMQHHTSVFSIFKCTLNFILNMLTIIKVLMLFKCEAIF